MSTVSQIKELLQRVLGQRADELARETHFVQRQRKLSGSDFVQALVFGYLHEPNATTEDLIQTVQRRDTTISVGGLSQRFTKESVTFMERVMQELIQEPVQAEQPTPVPLFASFDAVVLEDSSTIRLPHALRSIYRGCGGGQGQSQAGLKLHVRWELKHGGLQGPVVTESRCADQRSPLRQQGIAARHLNVTDQGYCCLKWLKQQEGWYLTRPRSLVVFLDPATKRPLDVEQIGPKVSNQAWQADVLAGSQAHLPTRLILIRVPDEVIEQRRERIAQEAKRRGTPIHPEVWKRAQWTILITNVPADQLSISEVVVIQRARWQIERLFRLWKEGGKIDEWRGRTPWRILCEIYAKVMALLIEHWLLVLGTWQDPYRSLFKAAKVVRRSAPELLSALVGEGDWQRVVTRLFKAMQVCRLHRRRTHPSHPQLLLEGLDWGLT